MSAAVSLFRACRSCGIVDEPLRESRGWAEDTLCAPCLRRGASEAVRAMARRNVARRAALRAEYGEMLANHNDAYNSLRARHERERHDRHRLWSRWRITPKVLGWAYQMGLISSHGWTVNSACNGCTAGVRWRGRRPYVLGWERERWTCLLKGRHRRTVIPGTSLCTVCAPCWVCRSTDPTHDAWACELARDVARKQAVA